MKKKELRKRIEELEERVAILEALRYRPYEKPPVAPVVPYKTIYENTSKDPMMGWWMDRFFYNGQIHQ